jgi:hypothetical protein
VTPGPEQGSPTPSAPPPSIDPGYAGPPIVPTRAIKSAAALKLSTVRRAGRRVTVSGRLARSASGRVTVGYRARVGGRYRTVRHRATIRSGAFRSTFTLSRSIAAPRQATITVTYAGDADTKSASARSTLRLRSR